MATFQGTSHEFKRYIGPRLRNLVQQITKQHKASAGACEHCGSSGELQAAHVHGRDRTDIIEVLLGTNDPRASVSVDLEQFEASFKAEHEPFEKAFLILCSDCHRAYDLQSSVPRPTRAGRPTGTVAADGPSGGGMLPITLEPAPVERFKEALLRRKSADIEVRFLDGRSETRSWNASRFSEESNVFANLRSRPEFRQGAWQSAGIAKVHVRVRDDA